MRYPHDPGNREKATHLLKAAHLPAKLERPSTITISLAEAEGLCTYKDHMENKSQRRLKQNEL